LADSLNLASVGIEPTENGKIVVNEADGTIVPNIHAIGDIQQGKLELTPTAIQAGRLLSHRLFGGDTKLMDYTNVPTTVFTPLEYSCCGYSEEQAIEAFGEENIEVYHSFYPPLEWQFLDNRREDNIYAKVICDKNQNEKVIGAHYLGPNAGEVM
jgi:thioredoxin reductase (NADPH)